MYAANVFRSLRGLGVAYRVVGDSLRFPKGTVPPELIQEIQKNKGALLAGACGLCGAELATDGDRCAWCDAIRGREVSYQPGSDAERIFLEALNHVA